jgi:hypothetical protein
MSRKSLLDNYVERQSAEKLQAKFGEALQHYQTSNLVFHLNGLGGVGKTTLIEKLKQKFKAEAEFIEVSFGITTDIDTPIKLMKKFHQQFTELPQPNFLRQDLFKKDSFQELDQQYNDAIKQLETTTVSGKQGIDKEQLNLVRSLTGGLVKFVAKNLTLGSSLTEPIAEKGGEALVDIASIVLSEKDRIVQLLQQHHVTKENQELQELLLNPIPQLTQAWIETLSQRKKPLILIFDTYEKVLPDIDTWLWQSLIANTDVQQSPVRIIIAGRKNILTSESWHKLNQDHGCIYDLGLDRFDEAQTQEYLEKIRIHEHDLVTQICQVTKGLPYYLDKIRERREKNEQIDYSGASEFSTE